MFIFGDKGYMIIADYFFNFWEIYYLPKTGSRTVMWKVKAHFAWYGIPDIVISDNRQQFVSGGLQKFSKNWDFDHITSSPGILKATAK